MTAENTSDNRFGPSRRLKKRREFLKIQQTGRKHRSEHLLLALLPTEGESRLGVTVTTKVDKSSVQRNRLKRRLKEVWRRERHAFQNQAEFVVIALAGATKLDYRGVERELLLLLRKAGFLPRLETEEKQGVTNQDGDERGE